MAETGAVSVRLHGAEQCAETMLVELIIHLDSIRRVIIKQQEQFAGGLQGGGADSRHNITVSRSLRRDVAYSCKCAITNNTNYFVSLQ